MAIIDVKVEIQAHPDEVWKIISDLDSEPKFWKGTKEVKNISKNGNLIHRQVIIAFRDQKCLQVVQLYPKEKIEIKFIKGVIDGTKTIHLIPNENDTTTTTTTTTIMHTNWNIKLTGMMAMFTGMIKKHIKNGTEQAMNSIKAEIER